MVLKLKFAKYDSRHHGKVVFEWMNNPEDQVLFLANRLDNCFQDFEGRFHDLLKHFYHDFFIVETDSGEPMGMVYSYDLKSMDRHCKIAIYLSPKWRSGHGALAAIQLLDYMFCRYPLKRVYCDIYSYNTESLACTLQCGFEEIGRIPEYRYYNGEYHDLVLLTITREEFELRWKKILQF